MTQSVTYWVVLMRIIPVLLLMTSGLALTACAGGGGGLSAAGILASKGDVCKIQEVCGEPPPPPGPVTDSDGDGISDADEDDGANDGTTGSGAGGNTPTVAVGNKTIAMQKYILDDPGKDKVALSTVTSSQSGTYAATEAAILAGNAPKKMLFAVNTNSDKNSQWAVPIEMNEKLEGTRDLRWIGLGHTTVDFTNPAAYSIVDDSGNPVVYNVASRRFEYTVTHTTTDGYLAQRGKPVDHLADSYWNQIFPYMASKANGGAKSRYTEYAIESTKLNRDEVLQVWSWGDSYTTQYVNQIGSGAPKQNAWSFGGNESTSVPGSGVADYEGRFVGVALGENIIPPENSKIDPNVPWRLQGKSNTRLNFNTGAVTATATPETWTSWQKPVTGGGEYEYTFTTSAVTIPHTNNPQYPSIVESVPTTDEPYITELYDTVINLNGNLVASSSAPGAPKNAIVGTATLNNGYNSTDNPMLGGTFKPNAEEVTLIFQVRGTLGDPEGGSTGQNDPRRSRLTISGSINGCTTAVPCTP